MPAAPNILYLHTHDTGRYVQPYGHAICTPHLQAFAEEGVLFRQAFAVAPTCSPSRAALLTGQYPHRCGVHGLASPPWGFQVECPEHLLMHTLVRAGYVTALAGLQHITVGTPALVRAQGFRVLLNEDKLGEDVPDLHERAARFIQTPPRAPWFLSVGIDQTHRDNRQGNQESGACFSQPDPYDPEKLDGRYCLPPPTVPDLPETRQDMASFKEGARQLDARIGHVLDALASSGQAADTIVMITTDHGIAWPGMKCNLTDQGLGVMLLLRGPGRLRGGRVVDAMVSQLDLFPTLCELIGVAPPAWLDGRSLLPLLRGDAGVLHEQMFFEQGWHELPEPQRAVRTTRYKYIRRFDPVGPKAANCDEGPTKRLMERTGFFERDLGHELLFDLYLDPQETCNRLNDPKLAPELTRLRQALHDWMCRTDDPLLSGRPVLPPGTRLACIPASTAISLTTPDTTRIR